MDLLLILMFIIGVTFAIIMGIASLFQDDEEIIKRFMENKPLSCASTPFVKPLVITKREWDYDADLNVFYHLDGRNFEPSDCDN